MAGTQDYILKNPEISQKLEQMWNNKNCCDTLFLVNKMEFLASSHLLFVSSSVLHSMVDNHFSHCGDREIRIGQVKQEDSFASVLKYIYGFEINLTHMNRAVLCEVLCLSDRFKILSFVQQLKSYMSKLDCFEMDSVVVLLNSAKKFNVKELYEKLLIFAFENANEFVKHGSFDELQYDVLRDLIKSNFFYALEIDILIGVLTWHSKNMMNTTCTVTLTTNNKNGIQSVVEEHEAEESKNQFKDKNLIVQGAEFSDGSSQESLDHGCVSGKEDNGEELVKTFSKNILKSLLSHIRFSRISVSDLYELMCMDIYQKYKEILEDCKYCSTSNTPRNKYVAPALYLETNTFDVIRKFTVRYDNENLDYNLFQRNLNDNNEENNVSDHDDDGDDDADNNMDGDSDYVDDDNNIDVVPEESEDTMFKSVEECSIGDMKWKIGFKEHILSAEDEDGDVHSFDMYLNCTSDEVHNWECTAHFQVRMISHKRKYIPTQITPGDNIHSTATLSLDSSWVNVGTFYFSSTWLSGYVRNNLFTFEVHFKSIHSKVKIEQ